jgi:hypothetical protein
MHNPNRSNATYPQRRERQIAKITEAANKSNEAVKVVEHVKAPFDEAAVLGGHVAAEHDLPCVAAHLRPTGTAARTPQEHAEQTSTLTQVEAKGHDGSRKHTIWASTATPKELKTTPSAVFIILDREYKATIDRKQIVRSIHAKIVALSKAGAYDEAIPIIVATSKYKECQKWAEACDYTDELFHFGGAETLPVNQASYVEVTWHIMVATHAPHRKTIRTQAFKTLADNHGLKGLFVRSGTMTICCSVHVDHKLALCWDLFDRFVHTEGNIWEWLVSKEAPSDLGLMSALYNHTHSYVQDMPPQQAHIASQNIQENITLIQNMKAAQYACADNNDVAIPKGRIKLSYALLAKYVRKNHVLAYIRQVRNLSRTLPTEVNEPVFKIQNRGMFAAKDFLPNEYITLMKGALVLRNDFRNSSTLNVNIGEQGKQTSDAFCFLVDDKCPVNCLKVADDDGANVRIFTHKAEEGWLEYILVSTKLIKKVTAPT